MSKWIKCCDQLPEERTDVLLANADADGISIGFRVGSKWLFNYPARADDFAPVSWEFGGKTIWYFTYWSPLPEVPTE